MTRVTRWAQAMAGGTAVLLLAGCGGTEVEVNALRELLGSSASTAERSLSREDVANAARHAGVVAGDVEQVAVDPSRTVVWSKAARDLAPVANDQARAVVLTTACDVVVDVENHKVDPYDDAALEAAVVEHATAEIAGLFQPMSRALEDDTKQLVKDIGEAVDSPDKDERTAASVACYTVKRVV